jgi:hypothetical protein
VSEASVTEVNDRADIRARYERVMAHLGTRVADPRSGDLDGPTTVLPEPSA